MCRLEERARSLYLHMRLSYDGINLILKPFNSTHPYFSTNITLHVTIGNNMTRSRKYVHEMLDRRTDALP